jgi:ATP-binding cassette subfamily F protein 3
MIQFTDAGKRFGPKILFQNLNWLITPQDRIGLVGANGTGKSTLLKVLSGLESLDYGSVMRTKGISAGYLPQDGLSLSGRTVFAECLSVFDDVHAMERELEDLTRRMSEIDPAGAEYEQVTERFHRVQTEFLTRDGYTLESQVGLAAADRRVQRRLADAYLAGQTATGKAEHAAARRAYEPPRS